MFQWLDQPIMGRAEKEQSATNFLGDLIICYDFVIVAHLGCSCSDRKRVHKYKPTWVLYLARPWSPCRLLSSRSFPDVKGVFFFSPTQVWGCCAEQPSASAAVLPSQSQLSKVQPHCRTLQEEKTKENVTPWSFRLTMELSENNWALPARNKEWAGRPAGRRQQPAPAGCHLKSEIKRRFSCAVETDEINEAESVWVSFPFETQISVAAPLISPQCLEGKGNAARWFSSLLESRGCQKEHLDSRHIMCNIIIHDIHSTPHCPGQTLAFLLKIFYSFFFSN